MKRIILLVILLLMITGCRDKTLDETYKKMLIKEDGLTSYQVNIRINGDYHQKRLNQYYQIRNYQDEQIIIREPSNLTNSENYIIIDKDKTYKVTSHNGKETRTILKDFKYEGTDIYIGCLKKLKEVKQEPNKKVNNNTYSVYSIKTNKKTISSILKGTVLEEIELDGDVSGVIWIDKDGYVNKMVYYLNKSLKDHSEPLELSINYTDYNDIKPRKYIDNLSD